MSDIGLEKRCDGLRQYESIGRLSSEKLNGMEKKKKKKARLASVALFGVCERGSCPMFKQAKVKHLTPPVSACAP